MSHSDPQAQLTQTIEGALLHAARTFSELVEATCQPTASKIVMQSVPQLPSLLGSAEKPMTGILLTLRRDLGGFLLLLLPTDVADTLVSRLLGTATYDGTMRRSALGELGNVVGSSFLNYLADELDMTVLPSPPQVVEDMVGAMLSSIGAYLALHGQAEFPVIQTTFRGTGLGFGAYLLWLPEALQPLGERA